MKKLLFLFSISLILFSCSSDDNSEKDSQNGTLIFNSYYVDKLSTGEDHEIIQPLAVIHIWNADNTDFDFEKSKDDLLRGYIYDKIQNKSLKANFSLLNTSTLTSEFNAGKYVIYVNYGEKTNGRATFAHSYTYFEIKKNEVTILKKYLKKDGDYPAFKYHKW